VLFCCRHCGFKFIFYLLNIKPTQVGSYSTYPYETFRSVSKNKLGEDCRDQIVVMGTRVLCGTDE
jgi:hypothetical protein